MFLKLMPEMIRFFFSAYIFLFCCAYFLLSEVKHLLYLQLKPRAELSPGCPLLLRHVADAFDIEDVKVMDLPVPCPQTTALPRWMTTSFRSDGREAANFSRFHS